MEKRSKIYFAFKKLGVGFSTHRMDRYIPKHIREKNRLFLEAFRLNSSNSGFQFKHDPDAKFQNLSEVSSTTKEEITIRLWEHPTHPFKPCKQNPN